MQLGCLSWVSFDRVTLYYARWELMTQGLSIMQQRKIYHYTAGRSGHRCHTTDLCTRVRDPVVRQTKEEAGQEQEQEDEQKQRQEEEDGRGEGES